MQRTTSKSDSRIEVETFFPPTIIIFLLKSSFINWSSATIFQKRYSSSSPILFDSSLDPSSLNMDQLSSELLLPIFKCLDSREMVNVMRVRKKWLEIIDENAALWRILILPEPIRDKANGMGVGIHRSSSCSIGKVIAVSKKSLCKRGSSSPRR